MGLASLIAQSFRHYWKNHIGLLIGAFLASAILSGSLVVGDSVRASLRRAGEQRLGKVQSGILGGDRWFTEELAIKGGAAPVILSTGSVSSGAGNNRANAVQVLGVDDAFWKLSPSGEAISDSKTSAAVEPSAIAINLALARRLGVKVGDSLLVRLEKPSAISRDAPLSGEATQDVTMRRTITAIIPPESFGAFQLSASQTAPLNAFIPLAELAAALEKKGRVNAMLSAAKEKLGAATLEDFALKLQRIESRKGILPLPDEKGQDALSTESPEWQLTTERIFLDDALVDKVLKAMPQSHGVLTYMVNGFSSTKGKTAYSFVSGVAEEVSGFRFQVSDGATQTLASPVLKPETLNLKPSPASISQWLADDLGVALGDTFQMRYFTVGLGREMKEQSAKLRVAGVIPMTDPRMNPSWTPNFPGITDSKNCRDWQPGVPMKLDTIRDKDEAYWKEYKATPKAFIALADGQRLWANRFGKLTAIRFAESRKSEVGSRNGEVTNPQSAIRNPQSEAELRSEILSHLKLADIGLIPRDFRAEAVAAAQGSVDFGGLFVGLSLFLIVSALVFSALLFLFTLEMRVSQIGLMLALGLTTRQVRRVILGEAGLVAVLGAVLGIGGGILYTKAALAGLNGVWSGATVGLRLVYDAKLETLGIALVSSVLASFGTLWWASRRIFKGRAKDLMSGEIKGSGFTVQRLELDVQSWKLRAWRSLVNWLPAVCVVLAIVFSFIGSRATKPEEIAGMFFGAGFMLLGAGLMLIRRKLSPRQAGGEVSGSRVQVSGGTAEAPDLNPEPLNLKPSALSFGLRNITRRPGRSLAVIGMMAGGIFLVIAVNAFRLGAGADSTRRDSGTGGFALIGESTSPIYEDLNTPAAWDAFALDEKIMKQVRVVPFRVREGDDASCLNLNKAQRPMLCAVDAAKLAERKAFAFAGGSWEGLKISGSRVQVEEDAGKQGAALSLNPETLNLAIPAIADQATAMWGLGKGVGDTIAYTDAQGHEFQVKLVGLLAGSVLQGKVIINEAAFLEKYPDAAGYKFFLVDVEEDRRQEAGGRSGDEESAIRNPQSAIETVRTHLTRQLEQRGLALENSADRLAAFSEVQNTYIGIFTVLGGLGVLLGTAGLGVLALRNVLERRGEFGLMQALGFLPAVLRRMVLVEHVALLVGGLVLGLLSAAIAVWPNVRQSGGALPFGFLFWLNAGILAFGIAVCWLAAVMALRGRLLDAVRRE